jgi:anti-repressor protein
MENKEIIKVNNTDPNKLTVSGRELHKGLGVKSNYTTWFERMCEYGFAENIDYKTYFPNLESENHGGQNKIDHQITIDMAKELCMIQRTEKGKRYRCYFIECEKAWNSPEAIMARALQLANSRLETILEQNKQLEIKNNQLTIDNQVMKPKADYFDELVDRNLLLNFTDTAKELGIKRKDFIQFLLDNKYIYRDKKKNLRPYADKNDGLFELKESISTKTKWAGAQTLVTPKGRETFRLLCFA